MAFASIVRSAALCKGVQWSPLSLRSTLLAWWSADRADLISVDGAAVTSWRDIVGGYDAVQGVSAARPIYSSTSFNGAPSVTFDGIDDELSMTTQPFPSGTAESEIWGVVQQDDVPSSSTDRSFFGYGGADFTSHRRIFRIVSGGVNRVQARTGSGSASTSISGTITNFSSRHVVRGQFGAAQTAISADGNSSEIAAVVPATGTVRSRIGASSAAGIGSNFWQGKIRDVIVTGPLNSGRAADLLKWALNRRRL